LQLSTAGPRRNLLPTRQQIASRLWNRVKAALIVEPRATGGESLGRYLQLGEEMVNAGSGNPFQPDSPKNSSQLQRRLFIEDGEPPALRRLQNSLQLIAKHQRFE